MLDDANKNNCRIAGPNIATEEEQTTSSMTSFLTIFEYILNTANFDPGGMQFSCSN